MFIRPWDRAEHYSDCTVCKEQYRQTSPVQKRCPACVASKALAITEKAPKCACGCGKATKWHGNSKNGYWAKFAHGHHMKRSAPSRMHRRKVRPMSDLPVSAARKLCPICTVHFISRNIKQLCCSVGCAKKLRAKRLVKRREMRLENFNKVQELKYEHSSD